MMACVMALLFFTVSCEKDLPDCNTRVDKFEKSLTPSDEKKYLLDTGNELAGKIDAKDFQNLADLIGYIAKTFVNSELDEAYIKKIENKYGNDEKLRVPSPVTRFQKLITGAMDMAQHGGQSTRAGKDIIAITANLSDFYGAFTPQHRTDGSWLWVWDSSVKDRLEVSFVDDAGVKWVATLKGSTKVTTVKYYYEWNPKYVGSGDESQKYDAIETSIEVQVPATTEFTLKADKSKVISMTLNTEGGFSFEEKTSTTYLWYESYYWSYWYNESHEGTVALDFSNLKLSGKLFVNNYAEEFRTEASTSGVSIYNKVCVDKVCLLETKGELKGTFSNLNPLLNDIYNAEYEYDGYDDWIDRLTSAAFHVNVLGKVHADLSCPDIKALYKAVGYVSDCYDKSFEVWSAAVESFNKTYTAGLYNTNSKVPQASFYFEPRKETYWDWEENDLKPVICFAVDGSVYDVTEYFDEEYFDSVIYAFRRLGEDFERMFAKAFD